MAQSEDEHDKADAENRASRVQTEDEKGAGPINDPGSGVSKEDGSEDPDNMGRA